MDLQRSVGFSTNGLLDEHLQIAIDMHLFWQGSIVFLKVHF